MIFRHTPTDLCAEPLACRDGDIGLHVCVARTCAVNVFDLAPVRVHFQQGAPPSPSLALRWRGRVTAWRRLKTEAL